MGSVFGGSGRARADRPRNGKSARRRLAVVDQVLERPTGPLHHSACDRDRDVAVDPPAQVEQTAMDMARHILCCAHGSEPVPSTRGKNPFRSDRVIWSGKGSDSESQTPSWRLIQSRLRRSCIAERAPAQASSRARRKQSHAALSTTCRPEDAAAISGTPATLSGGGLFWPGPSART